MVLKGDEIGYPAPSLRSWQWSNSRIPLRTSLIPNAANRVTACTGVVAGSVDSTGEAIQAAGPGRGPGQDGGGPPISVLGNKVENSVVAPKSARQGREARRISRTRVW